MTTDIKYIGFFSNLYNKKVYFCKQIHHTHSLNYTQLNKK